MDIKSILSNIFQFAKNNQFKVKLDDTLDLEPIREALADRQNSDELLKSLLVTQNAMLVRDKVEEADKKIEITNKSFEKARKELNFTREEIEKLDAKVKELNNFKGEKGDSPSLQELREIIEPLILPPIKGDPGKDYVLTSKDKKEIAKSIKVPIVEKIVETIIEKQPIVTNEIKEVAVTDSSEKIKEKLESLEGDERLDAKAIKNLPKPSFGGGIKRIDGALDTRIISPTDGQALVWNSSRQVWENSSVSGGSGSPGGSDTQVQFNDGGAFGGDAGLVYNKTTNALTVGDVLVDDEAYDATNWNGSLEVPTKNAVRDKIETLQPLDADLTTIAGLTATTNNIIQSVSSAWASRTPTQVTATLDAMVGDSGAGGTKGLVPAPATGDATKFLKGDGTWGTPAGSGDVSKVGTPADNQIGVWTGDGTIEGDANLTWSGSLLTVTNATDSASVQVAVFQGDRATNADNDEAYISLKLSDDGGTQKEVARVAWVGTDINAATSVDGRLDFYVMTAGTLASELRLYGTTLTPTTNDGLALGVGGLGYSDLFLASGGVIDFASSTLQLTHSSDTLRLSVLSGSPIMEVRASSSTTSAAQCLLTQNSTGDAFARFALSTTISYAIGVDNSVAGDPFKISTAASGTAALGTGDIFTLTSAGALTLASSVTSTSVLATSNDVGALGASGTAWSDLFLASGGVINWNAGNATLTHSAGLLTSNVPISLGTSNALTCGTVELGHASDTTIARVSAGVISVEGVTIPSISSTNTLTNKRITPRVSSETSSATPTINTDNVDAHSITALAADITSFTTNLSGTPTNFQKLLIRIKDNGTARGITWGTSFEAKGVALPTTTTISKVLTVGFIYDSVTSKWGCVCSVNEA